MIYYFFILCYYIFLANQLAEHKYEKNQQRTFICSGYKSV